MEKRMTGGWTDLPLTERGIHQARCTGSYLAHSIITHPSDYGFYGSNLLRASQTASIIGSYISLHPHITADLRDTNNGTAAYCTQREAEKMRESLTYPLIDWVPYPGAENWRLFRDRIVNRIEDMPEKKVLIVSHSHVITVFIYWWLELDEKAATRISFDSDPCSITVLRINAWGEKTIATLNNTAHLGNSYDP
jgi:probable phosphoglycerate mutase